MPITTQDLIDFHVKHFGVEPENYTGFDSLIQQANSQNDSEQQQRYPDGTVRTLNDEQIEFFRNSELREMEREKQAATGKSNQVNRVLERANYSIEETKPFTPLNVNSDGDQELYGTQMAEYIGILEAKVDARFIDVCRRGKVKDYYPVIPLRNGL